MSGWFENFKADAKHDLRMEKFKSMLKDAQTEPSGPPTSNASYDVDSLSFELVVLQQMHGLLEQLPTPAARERVFTFLSSRRDSEKPQRKPYT